MQKGQVTPEGRPATGPRLAGPLEEPFTKEEYISPKVEVGRMAPLASIEERNVGRRLGVGN